MPKTSMYLETTDVSPSRSAAEITAELVRAGAKTISTDYGSEGQIVGVKWIMNINGQPVQFALPARIGAIEKLLREKCTTHAQRMKVHQKAERVAWRQLLRWVQIQNAMIQTGMAEAAEVFMPYACAPGTDQTMFMIWKNQLALPAPEQKAQ